MSPNLPCFTTFPGPGEPLLLSAAQGCLLRCSWSLVFPASCKGICQGQAGPSPAQGTSVLSASVILFRF